MGRKKLTFENAIESLEEIVRQMETGDIPLNELINKYNEGIKLSAFCMAELDRAEQIVNTEVKIDKNNKIIETKLNLEGE